jgi:hypothetical protein
MVALSPPGAGKSQGSRWLGLGPPCLESQSHPACSVTGRHLPTSEVWDIPVSLSPGRLHLEVTEFRGSWSRLPAPSPLSGSRSKWIVHLLMPQPVLGALLTPGGHRPAEVLLADQAGWLGWGTASLGVPVLVTSLPQAVTSLCCCVGPARRSVGRWALEAGDGAHVPAV